MPRNRAYDVHRPTVASESENFEEMLECRLLFRYDRGVRVSMQYGADGTDIDVTNPEARQFL